MSEETKSTTTIEAGLRALKAQIDAFDPVWTEDRPNQTIVAAELVIQTLPTVAMDPLMLTAVLIKALKMTVDAGIDVLDGKFESKLLAGLNDFLTKKPESVN